MWQAAKYTIVYPLTIYVGGSENFLSTMSEGSWHVTSSWHMTFIYKRTGMPLDLFTLYTTSDLDYIQS